MYRILKKKSCQKFNHVWRQASIRNRSLSEGKKKQKKKKREKKNVVGIDHPNSWQASRKASVWRDEKIRERKKEAIFFFFRESGPGSQAILRPKKKKKEKLQRIPRYKRSYILGNGLKPNLQLIAGFRMSGKKMGNWVTKKEAIGVKKGQKIKKEALNLQRVERKE